MDNGRQENKLLGLLPRVFRFVKASRRHREVILLSATPPEQCSSTKLNNMLLLFLIP